MDILEIHFNHDPRSMLHDALTIRQNYANGRVTAPEWRADQPAKPVAYASMPLQGSVTIKARFTGGPVNGSARVRAIDADGPREGTGCLGLLFYFILLILKSSSGNVLGNVAAKQITFDANGRSGLETFTLSNHRLKTCGVGIRTTTWIWQIRDERGWTEFARTQHRIFVILDAPRAPWSQQIDPVIVAAHGPAGGQEHIDPFIDNTQLPWASALEVACSWAAGATTKVAAATAIVKGVNTRTPQVYNTNTFFGGSQFLLTSYLARLSEGNAFSTNCTDCANAVTTLANLLGCDLWSQYLSTSFEPTKPFLTLNGDPLNDADWVSYTWSYHEFGWLGPPNDTGRLYDACLQVNVSDDANSRVPAHPAHMPYPAYWPRLWDSAGGLDTSQQRREVI